MSCTARQKFNSIVDIQLMAERTKDKVIDLSKSQDKEILKKNRLSSYRQRLRTYLKFLSDWKTRLNLELKVLSHNGEKEVKGSKAYGMCIRQTDTPMHLPPSMPLK